jgi:DNA ligase-1
MAFQPMSAATAEDLERDVHFPAYISAKFDGIRFVVRGGVALSKKNKPLPNQWLQALVRSHPAFEGLDGEVVVGSPVAPDVWNASQSFTMSKAKVPSDMGGRAVYLHVFDMVDEEAGYAARLGYATRQVKKLPSELRRYVQVVEQTLCTHASEAMALEAKYTAAGYEGIMGRKPDGLYKFGRSTLIQGWLWKLKRWYDAEARIDVCVEEQHNTNAATVNELGKTKRSSAKAGKVGKGVLGGFQVTAVNGRDEGTTFNCGTGTLTASECARLWKLKSKLPGLHITYKAQATAVAGGMPRFCGFLRWPEDQATP